MFLHPENNLDFKGCLILRIKSLLKLLPNILIEVLHLSKNYNDAPKGSSAHLNYFVRMLEFINALGQWKDKDWSNGLVFSFGKRQVLNAWNIDNVGVDLSSQSCFQIRDF